MHNLEITPQTKWTPLYHRLVARLSQIPKLEFEPDSTAVKLNATGSTEKTPIGLIEMTEEGLEIGLKLNEARTRAERLRPLHPHSSFVTHQVRICSAQEIDEELVSWIKAAKGRACCYSPATSDVLQ